MTDEILERTFQVDVDAIKQIPAVPKILEVVCRTTGMGFAAVARVTEQRWICCAVRDEIAFGLQPGGELKVETTICNEIRRSHQAVVIDEVAQDDAYGGHPTPALYGFQSYISMPILLADGSMFGTLCAIDPQPNRLNTPETVGMFKLFAELIATHLDAGARVASSEASLINERKGSELREQFIAVLGHDLRNPLASIAAGIGLIQRAKSESRVEEIAVMMQSSVSRMSRLIDDVMDFARGRLGSGLNIERNSDAALEPVLQQVVAELRASQPGRLIETEFALTRTVRCDHARISQLFSNLLGNALTHGAPNSAIRVRAVTTNDAFELAVTNGGERIPADVMEHLFRPFYRGKVRPSLQGLGLGLYIASEIARAHGGTLEATSTDAETCFTFRMPL